MKQFRVLAIVALALSLMAVPVALLAQEIDPVQVCYGPEFEAWLAGEDTNASIFAEDAVRTVVVGDMIETYRGREEIDANLDELMANGFAYEVTVLSVEGNTVTAEGKSWDNDTRALGVAPLVGTEVCIVQDGKIQSLTWTMSEASLAAMGAALAALPQTGGPSLPSHLVIVALGAAALATGLGLRHLTRIVRHGL